MTFDEWGCIHPSIDWWSTLTINVCSFIDAWSEYSSSPKHQFFLSNIIFWCCLHRFIIIHHQKNWHTSIIIMRPGTIIDTNESIHSSFLSIDVSFVLIHSFLSCVRVDDVCTIVVRLAASSSSSSHHHYRRYHRHHQHWVIIIMSMSSSSSLSSFFFYVCEIGLNEPSSVSRSSPIISFTLSMS